MAHQAGLPSSAPATLASAELPPRVREILAHYLGMLGRRLAPVMDEALRQAERQLTALASESHISARQVALLAGTRALRENGPRLLPALLADIESQLARIRQPQTPASTTQPMRLQTMTLVEDESLDQEIVLRDMARRCETRCGATLHALGVRFAALAASTTFEPGQVPAGPQSLCRSLRVAAPVLQLDELEILLHFYRAFERTVLVQHDALLESLNALLAEQGVLPNLVHSPRRMRNARKRSEWPTSSPAQAQASAVASDRPLTGWHGQGAPSAWAAGIAGLQPAGAGGGGTVAGGSGHDGAGTGTGTGGDSGQTGQTGQEDAADDRNFAILRHVLQGRRAAISGEDANAEPADATPRLRIDTRDTLTRLGGLQSEAIQVVAGRKHRTFRDVQQQLLASAREAHGQETELDPRDADSFELLDMLYAEIEREVKPDAPCVELLVRLQVPVARASLLDRRFFTSPRHPARELLNMVAESGAVWLEQDAEDPQLAQKLHSAVDRVVNEYDGNEAVLERANRDIQQHLDSAARRAALSERRHVEAAQGKDRLEVSRRMARAVIAGAFDGNAPDFALRKLLDHVWHDVLTLTLLRKGETSAEWQAARDITSRIAAASASASNAAAGDPALAARIAEAMRGTGFGENEATLFSERLAQPHAPRDGSGDQADALLNARTWLGQHLPQEEHLPQRNAEEEARHAYLLTLPFGTWFEFVQNQQGDAVRRRMSWYSNVTGNTLFVNAQGKRVAEMSLDQLARLMARDQARVVAQDKGRLIDRAWRATLDVLRAFAPGSGP